MIGLTPLAELIQLRAIIICTHRSMEGIAELIENIAESRRMRISMAGLFIGMEKRGCLTTQKM